jgi:hypothetical protein
MNANGVTNFQDELETMSKSETKSFALEKGNGVVSKHLTFTS